MIIDSYLEFSDGQAFASGASTNILDLKVGGDTMDHELMVVAKAIGSGASSASLTVALQTSDDEAFSSPTTLATVTGTGKVAFRMPRGAKRYLRLNYTATTNSALTIWAGLVPGDQHGWETQD